MGTAVTANQRPNLLGPVAFASWSAMESAGTSPTRRRTTRDAIQPLNIASGTQIDKANKAAMNVQCQAGRPSSSLFASCKTGSRRIGATHES
jgi:hypothetical protein